MTLKWIEQIAKIILGSGLFAFLITETWQAVRRFRYKKRIIKEIAFEFIWNEGIAKKVINDFQNLIKDPCGYLNKHIFKTHVISAVISSSYFVNLNSDLTRVIFEFDQRFKKVQYELDIFFKLEDDQKILPPNLHHLKAGESDSKQLLDDLIKSKKITELKKKNYKKWTKERIKHMEEQYNKKIGKERKRIIIKYMMKEVDKR
jgi:hypothetical protein